MKKLHNEEFNGLYTPIIILVIKSRRMCWAGYIARLGRGEVDTGLWGGNLRERNALEDTGLVRKKILRWIFGKWKVREWTG